MTVQVSAGSKEFTGITVALSAKPEKTMTIKIGMIGAGVISDAHLLTLETITEAEVAVIADEGEHHSAVSSILMACSFAAWENTS